jgi:hypothetical protein
MQRSLLESKLEYPYRAGDSGSSIIGIGLSKHIARVSLTPAKAIPREGKAAANTALPQPPKTSQKVQRILQCNA